MDLRGFEMLLLLSRAPVLQADCVFLRLKPARGLQMMWVYPRSCASSLKPILCIPLSLKEAAAGTIIAKRCSNLSFDCTFRGRMVAAASKVYRYNNS